MNSRLNASSLRDPMIALGAKATRAVGLARSAADMATLVLGSALKIITEKAGHVYVVDKIRICANTAVNNSNLYVGLNVKTAAGVSVGVITINMSSQNTTTSTGRVDETIELGGSLVIPENHYVEASISGGSNLTVVAPEIHGAYMPAFDAMQAGIYNGTEATNGNWFVAFYHPVTTSTDNSIELVAAKAGKSIEIQGAIFSGRSTAGSVVVRVNHGIGSVYRQVLRFSTSNQDTNRHCLQSMTHLQRCLPIGANVTLETTVTTTGTNDASHTSICLWGRYTDNPDTFNPYGLPDLWGSETGAGSADPTVITDSKRLWETDKYKNLTVRVTSGECINQERVVLSNTATALTVTVAFDGTIATDDTFEFVVPKGRKWWVSRGAVACTATNERSFSLLPPSLNMFAEIREFQMHGRSNPDPDTTIALTTYPAFVLAVGANAAAKSSLTAITASGGIYNVGDGVGATLYITSPSVATISTVDCQTQIDRVLIPVAVTTGLIPVAVISNVWTDINFSVGGTLAPYEKYSNSNPAVAARYGR